MTIKNIIVYKNRSQPIPSYGFKLSTYIWARHDNYDPSDLKEKILELQAPDNHCILIVKNTGDLYNDLQNGQYLNLSPFLIDNNFLYDKAQIPDISFFETTESDETTKSERFIYKRLNEPSKDKFPISNNSGKEETTRFYDDLKKQFDHFESLLSQPGTHVPTA